jgi:hypothetical protein
MPGDGRFRWEKQSSPMHPVRFGGFAIALCTSLTALAAEPAIRVVNGPDGKPVAVEGIGWIRTQLTDYSKLAKDEGALFSSLTMCVVETDGIEPPAMAGKYAIVGDALRFTPAYPLRPGMKYRVRFRLPPPAPEFSPWGDKVIEIAIPALPPGEPTKVTAIYPSATVLPENQLRFYLHFSAPMRQGEAYGHVKLLKADGKPVERAFLEIGEELWDTTGTRLTLLFDPGRVKQGLKPREEFGPVIVAGQEYRLVIDKAWRDAEGKPLTAGFEKRFRAGPMSDAALDHKQWKVTSPAAGTRDPLVIRFPHPLDRALLEWTITIESAAGKSVAGEIAVTDEERQWEFRPDQPWPAGEFSLIADTTLEDSAGNNLSRPFEVDVFDKVERQVVAEYVRLPFAIVAKDVQK